MRTFAGSWIRFAFCSVALASMLSACGGGGSGAAPAQGSAGGAPVSSGNTAPTISGTAGTSATAGQAYSFTPTASDADHDTITFTIANKPSWAAFNGKT